MSTVPGERVRRVRVVHLTTSHDAFDTRIFWKECRTLAAAGYEVTLVVPHDRDETRDGVRVHALSRPSGRAARATRTAWQAYRAAHATGATVCHLHDPELLPFGLLLRLAGRRVIYDAHENLPGDVRSKHYLPARVRALLAVAVDLLERAACALLNGVVAATPGIAGRFDPRRTALVRNFPLLAEFPATDPTPHAARAPGIVYLGGLNVIRGAREMVRAVGLLEPALGAELWLAGRFDPPSLAGELAREPGWARTRCLPWLSRAEVAATLARARVGLLVLHPVPNHLDSLPIKLFEYMAAGLPVVASRFAAWEQVLGGAGRFVDPLDPAAIARELAALLRDPAAAEASGREGRARIEREYHWEHEAATLLALYREVTARSRAGERGSAR